MRKTILMLTLLFSAMNIMAQAYVFETEENTLDNGRIISCQTKERVELNVSSPDIGLFLQDFYDKEMAPQISFGLFKYTRGHYMNSFSVAKSIRKLAISISKSDKGKEGITINVYLSNGDVLHGVNRGMIFISSNQRYMLEKMDSIGTVDAIINIPSLKSSYIPREIQTKENLQVICQQLRTYDIVKIEVDGVSFDVRGLRSAATFDAMFNALAAKTDKGHLYRSSGASSSSSTAPSGPSATCELGFVAVYSWGGIGCRVDDFRIVGAKGAQLQ